MVADASFCGAWILEDESSEDAEDLLKRVETDEVRLTVPALWKFEMLNLLRSACRRGRLNEAEAAAAQKVLSRVPLDQVDVPDSVAEEKILELSQAHNLSAYDAAYLELAKRFQIQLRTADRALKKAAHDCGVETR